MQEVENIEEVGKRALVGKVRYASLGGIVVDGNILGGGNYWYRLGY